MSKPLGTAENPLRILVADNWGALPHPYMYRKYENCVFKVPTHAVSMHPHGHMVMECIMDMLPRTAHVELTLYPHLTLQRERPDGWLDMLKAANDAGTPFHLCNCSFGSSHGDDDLMRAFLDAHYGIRSKLYKRAEDILKNVPTIVTFASGNSNSATRRKPDPDNDVNYPQKWFAAFDRVFVIGACGPNAVPSLFSSDGEQVFAMYWGEAVPVYDPVVGRNTYVDGTSFASPFACGDIGRLLLQGIDVTRAAYFQHVYKEGWVKKGWERGKHSLEAGYGCMLPVQKTALPSNKAAMLTDPASLIGVDVTYLDFEQVQKKHKPPLWKRRAWKGVHT